MSSNQGRQRRVGRIGIGRAREAGRRRARPSVLMLEGRQLLTTFTVVNDGDALTSPGGAPVYGTLRWAVEQADAAEGPSTIRFALAQATDTIVLQHGRLELSGTGGPISIVGPKSGSVTVDGGGADRVFEVDRGVTASISGLTVTNDSSSGGGGGVLNLGTTTLSDVILTGNTGLGAAVDNAGTATLRDCTVTDNVAIDFPAGAVYNSGTLTMVDSTVSGNTGGWGVNSYGNATLRGCSITGNSWGGMMESGNGVSATLTGCNLSGNGGEGFFLDTSDHLRAPTSATLVDCTLSGNTAGGAEQFYSGPVVLDGCTLADNGAGKVYGGKNFGYGFGDSGSPSTLNDCTISGNLGNGVNNYNGVMTLNNCTVTGNSAGYFGGGVAANGSQTNLNGCLISGNSAGSYGGGVYVGGPVAMNGCTVSGNTAGHDGGGLFASGIQTLSIADSTIAGNTAQDQGGGLFAGVTFFGGSPEVTATGLLVVGNRATDGGGIANVDSASLTLSNSSVLLNTASHDGGGLYNTGAATLSRDVWAANSAAADGGAVYNDGVVALIDCTVTGNSATSGGGLFNTPTGTATLTRTRVKGNRGGDIVGVTT